jgi:hypothetical protein
MKPKAVVKIIVDIIMTIVLLIQMAYHLIGELAHEWIGVGMFILFIAHHILNWSLIRNLCRGKYNILRSIQAGINLLVFLSMIGMMVSGIMMSRYVFAFLPTGGGTGFARALHHVSAYWDFVLMSLHIGLHWGMMIGMAKRITKRASAPHKRIVFPIIGAIIAAYGAYAFLVRQFPQYMFLKIEFSFFDYEEPAILFFLDYFAIMGLFVFLVYYAIKLMQKFLGRKRPQT